MSVADRCIGVSGPRSAASELPSSDPAAALAAAVRCPRSSCVLPEQQQLFQPPCRRDLFDCLEKELPWNNYTAPVAAWLEAFPPGQLKLVQVREGVPLGGQLIDWMIDWMWRVVSSGGAHQLAGGNASPMPLALSPCCQAKSCDRLTGQIA